MPTSKLISFFRNSDQTGAIVGQRQASTFQVLAGLGGHGELPSAKPAGQPKKKEPAAKEKKVAAVNNGSALVATHQQKENGAVGLTVRIEINLPVAGDQKTYDLIFKSIRENLLRG